MPATGLRVFIATPTADGIMLAGYVEALARLVGRLLAAGIQHVFRSLDGTDLILQRNLLTDAFLRTDCTHLLFVDSDMAFPPDLAERLLAADKPLIGTVYSKRALDFAGLRTRLATRPFAEALPLTYDWNVRILHRAISTRGDICQVDGLGGGFLLIRRDCFATLLAQSDVPFVTGDARQPRLRAFFRDMALGDEVLDLDYSFCRRWQDCGGEVWAYPSVDLRHIGDDRAGVPFATALAATARPGAERAGADLVLSAALLPG